MKIVLILVTALLVALQLPSGLTSPTAPAFLWSPHQDGFANREVEAVNYRTLFSKDLAKSVMSEGGWSRCLCSGMETRQPLDFAILFVGKELQSVDFSKTKKLADPWLVDLLKGAFGNSNFSLAFPYVAAADENETIESSLLAEFENTCGNSVAIKDIAILDSCSLDGERFEKLSDMPAVQDYLASKKEKRSMGQGNLIVACHGGILPGLKSDFHISEADLLSKLISTVEHFGAKYTVLYVSDPNGHFHHRSHHSLGRFLAEGNVSANLTSCDGVCQIKSSMLEGLFVAIVLLIILISGLCCMAQIDTPTRFETPQDS